MPVWHPHRASSAGSAQFAMRSLVSLMSWHSLQSRQSSDSSRPGQRLGGVYPYATGSARMRRMNFSGSLLNLAMHGGQQKPIF